MSNCKETLVNARKFLKKREADVPTLKEIHAIRPGKWVKLMLHQQHDPCFWVEVAAVNGTGRFVGRDRFGCKETTFTAKTIMEVDPDFVLVEPAKEGYQPFLGKVEVGGAVKVGCRGKGWCKREWFFVTVDEDLGEGNFAGEIENLLITRYHPSACDRITFNMQNVLFAKSAERAQLERAQFDKASESDFDSEPDDELKQMIKELKEIRLKMVAEPDA